ARLLRQVLVQDRERTQRLRGDLPLLGEDAQLPAARADDPPAREQVVTKVDVVLEVLEGLRPNLTLAQHDLEALARTVLEGREAQPAGVALEHDPPRDADDVLGLLARLERTFVLLADLGDRRRDGDAHGIGLDAAREHLLALGPPDALLLGQAVSGLVGLGLGSLRLGHRAIVPRAPRGPARRLSGARRGRARGRGSARSA